MRKIHYILVLVCISVSLVSCESLWKEKISNEWSSDEMWHVASLAEGVLLNAYYEIPVRMDYYDDNYLDVATDNAVTNSYDAPIYKLAHGSLSVNNNPIANWDHCYEEFQYINSFIENGLTENTVYVKNNPDLDKMYKERALGCSYFLRAYWGFQLLKVYGGKTDDGQALGYPLAMHFITPEKAEVLEEFSRNTYEECVLRIIEDCELAINYLPNVNEWGNSPINGVGSINVIYATKASAHCLQSMAALYGASPAYQPDDIVTMNGGVGEGFTVVNQAKYDERWQRAARYAALAISVVGDFIPLVANNMADVPNQPTQEFLMRNFHNDYVMEQTHFPPRYLGKARSVPSQNLVDAFPMASGYPITDERSGYDETNPYQGRDKRFYLNVYYHGGLFGKDGEPVDVSEGGADSQGSSRYSSRTGYYLAKTLSTSSVLLNPTNPVNSRHYTPLLRRTEVWLNFAEAANEAYGPKTVPSGSTYSAYDVIKMIRQKSGSITDVTYLDEAAASKDDFRKLIQNERRIELAFENHRYFDMRRWLLDLNEPVYGVQVSVDDADVAVYRKVEVERRNFDDVRYYYAPLPYDECIKNPAMKNNLGWM